MTKNQNAWLKKDEQEINILKQVFWDKCITWVNQKHFFRDYSIETQCIDFNRNGIRESYVVELQKEFLNKNRLGESK